MAYVEKLYRQITANLQQIENLEKRPAGNPVITPEFIRDQIESLCDQFMPSGSGWDLGTKFDFDKSNPNKLVFYGEYHHMNDGGYYDGWTDHTITVTPDLHSGKLIKISGRNRNDIKDYLHELFDHALGQEIETLWNTETKEYTYRRIPEAWENRIGPEYAVDFWRKGE